MYCGVEAEWTIGSCKPISKILVGAVFSSVDENDRVHLARTSDASCVIEGDSDDELPASPATHTPPHAPSLADCHSTFVYSCACWSERPKKSGPEICTPYVLAGPIWLTVTHLGAVVRKKWLQQEIQPISRQANTPTIQQIEAPA